MTDYVTDGANLNQMSLTGHLDPDLRPRRTLDPRQTIVVQVSCLLPISLLIEQHT